jgi:hypothetical protein
LAKIRSEFESPTVHSRGYDVVVTCNFAKVDTAVRFCLSALVGERAGDNPARPSQNIGVVIDLYVM